MYLPEPAWYDIIPVWRILAMEPLVPDYSLEGSVIGQGQRAWAPRGKVGNAVVFRNKIARNMGRCTPRVNCDLLVGPGEGRDTGLDQGTCL